MQKTNLYNLLNKKVVALIVITVFAIATFASLGDGKSIGKKASLLNNSYRITPGKFSLKSGYLYRGSQVVNQQKNNDILSLNSIVTYQRGNMTFILPVKTTVNTQKFRVSVGVPNLSRN